MKLDPVQQHNPWHLLFLYKLLEEREPTQNISHKKMPEWSAHKKFVASKPYSAWYILKDGGKKVGAAYLSRQDEIGLFLFKKFQGKGLGDKALAALIKSNPRDCYYANINPANKASIKFFKRHGFKLAEVSEVQETYRYDNT